MKTPRLVFRPQAARELLDTKAWYDAQRAGLGLEFAADAEVTIELVGRAAGAFAVVHRDIRRARLRRFPYGVFYRLVGEEIVVLAVLHLRRNPRRWRSRR